MDKYKSGLINSKMASYLVILPEIHFSTELGALDLVMIGIIGRMSNVIIEEKTDNIELGFFLKVRMGYCLLSLVGFHLDPQKFFL